VLLNEQPAEICARAPMAVHLRPRANGSPSAPASGLMADPGVNGLKPDLKVRFRVGGVTALGGSPQAAGSIDASLISLVGDESAGSGPRGDFRLVGGAEGRPTGLDCRRAWGGVRREASIRGGIAGSLQVARGNRSTDRPLRGGRSHPGAADITREAPRGWSA
jgi:hypothetical protein